MKTFLFSEIEKVFVNGSCNGEIKTFFSNLKNTLIVKPEDADEQHPMEIERKARKKAREEAAIRRQREELNARFNGHGIRFAYNPTATFTATPPSPEHFGIKAASEKKMKPFSRDSIYENSIIIVSGDCGLGSNIKEKHYIDILEKYNKILQYNNTFVILVRGENDDPSFFNETKIDLSNIKSVPDYSIIQTKNKNILCIGGAVSIDRIWKKEQEKRINSLAPDKKKIFFWENEAPIFDIERLKEAINSVDRIDYVVSHSAPSFVNPIEIEGIEEWSKKDKALIDDMYQERLAMDKVFETLRDNGRKPEYWAFGHFGVDCIEKRSNTVFRSLESGFSPRYTDFDFTLLDAEKKLSKKSKSSFKKSITSIADFNHGGDMLEAQHDDNGLYFNIDGHEEEELNEMVEEEPNEMVEIGQPQEQNVVVAGDAPDVDYMLTGTQAHVNNAINDLYERFGGVFGNNVATYEINGINGH